MIEKLGSTEMEITGRVAGEEYCGPVIDPIILQH